MIWKLKSLKLTLTFLVTKVFYYLFTRYTGSNMMTLEWDDELARGSELWAAQCQFQHDINDICRFKVNNPG